jgi:hypothetical protein
VGEGDLQSLLPLEMFDEYEDRDEFLQELKEMVKNRKKKRDDVERDNTSMWEGRKEGWIMIVK